MPVLNLDIAVGIYIAVVLVLLGKYLETRLAYVVWWTAGAAALAARAAAHLALLSSAPAAPLALLPDILVLAGAGCFLTGSVARDPGARGTVVMGGAGYGGLLIAAALLVWLGPEQHSGVRPVASLAAGLAFVLAAAGYHHAEDTTEDWAGRIIVAGLAAVGLNVAGWAVAARTPHTIGASELLGGFCVAIFGAGIHLRSIGRQRALEIMSCISAALHKPRHVHEMLAEVLEATGEMMRVRSAWIFLDSNRQDEVAAAYRLPAPLQHGGSAITGRCRCLDLLDSGHLPGAGAVIDCDRLTAAGTPTRHATVPLPSAGRMLGVLNAVLPPGRPVTHRELSLLSAIGAQVGLAMEKARLLDELREKERGRTELIRRLLTAQEDERKRIARELHDEAGQYLAGLMLELEAARLDTTRGTAVGPDTLARLRRLAARTVEAVRGLIYDLRPAVLDDLGLVPALRWYTQTQIASKGLAVHLSERLGRERLDTALETALFRITQEALWNAVKHAGATRVDVELFRQNGGLVLRVRDNGRGLAQDSATPSRTGRVGVGLGGMQERAAVLGGSVRIMSSPGGGTEVAAEFPAAALRRGRTA